jgi:hypothetical protein
LDCSEGVTREIITPVSKNSDNPQLVMALILKEFETTSLYTFDPAACYKQRSATFLLSSQTSPVAHKCGKKKVAEDLSM